MAIAYLPPVVMDGLVLYLDAANTKSYPGSGTAFNDLTINNYNFTLNNGPTFSSDNLGSIVFDGVDDFGNTTSNLAFGTNPFAIDIWFKPNITQTNNATLIGIASAFAATNWQISYNLTSNVFVFFSDTSVDSTYTPDNTWTNMTYVRESTATNGFKIYVNGEFDVQGTQANNFTDTAGYRIGLNRGGVQEYAGNISSVKIYNRALTATEVLQNFNAVKTRFGL